MSDPSFKKSMHSGAAYLVKYLLVHCTDAN